MAHYFEFYEGIGLTIAEQAFVQDLAAAANYDASAVPLLPAVPLGHFLRDDGTYVAINSGLSVITTSDTIDDSNVSFSFASAPTLVVVNGNVYRDGHGCSISGMNVTLDYPVGTGGDIYALG